MPGPREPWAIFPFTVEAKIHGSIESAVDFEVSEEDQAWAVQHLQPLVDLCVKHSRARVAGDWERCQHLTTDIIEAATKVWAGTYTDQGRHMAALIMIASLAASRIVALDTLFEGNTLRPKNPRP